MTQISKNDHLLFIWLKNTIFRDEILLNVQKPIRCDIHRIYVTKPIYICVSETRLFANLSQKIKKTTDD